MLHIIWSIIVGFFIGLIARAIMPGAEHLGFLATSLVGIGGSIVGGLIETQGRTAVSSGRDHHVDCRRVDRALCHGQDAVAVPPQLPGPQKYGDQNEIGATSDSALKAGSGTPTTESTVNGP
jgi:uncharacterized membrane protein YeaQ/YmgE (transglycosylase-associated protein family)